jgi:hypothetical protein
MKPQAPAGWSVALGSNAWWQQHSAWVEVQQPDGSFLRQQHVWCWHCSPRIRDLITTSKDEFFLQH